MLDLVNPAGARRRLSGSRSLGLVQSYTALRQNLMGLTSKFVLCKHLITSHLDKSICDEGGNKVLVLRADFAAFPYIA